MQECVQLVLQQSTWFNDMIDSKIEDADIEDLVRDRVESSVSSWFDHEFCLTDHVDVDDLVRDAVDDRLSDQINDTVDDKLQELVDEKFSNISISFN
jgi:hypothetical protein